MESHADSLVSPVDSFVPNSLEIGYRYASIRRVEHQLTTPQVRAVPKRRRSFPTKLWPTDLQQVAQKCSRAQIALLIIQQLASTNPQAAVQQDLPLCTIWLAPVPDQFAASRPPVRLTRFPQPVAGATVPHPASLERMLRIVAAEDTCLKATFLLIGP